MKALYIVFLVLALTSCKKEEVPTTQTSAKVYIRVESVDLDGVSTYSPIVVTNINQ